MLAWAMHYELLKRWFMDQNEKRKRLLCLHSTVAITNDKQCKADKVNTDGEEPKQLGSNWALKASRPDMKSAFPIGLGGRKTEFFAPLPCARLYMHQALH